MSPSIKCELDDCRNSRWADISKQQDHSREAQRRTRVQKGVFQGSLMSKRSRTEQGKDQIEFTTIELLLGLLFQTPGTDV